MAGRDGFRFRRGKTVNVSVRGYSAVEFIPHVLERMRQRGVAQQEVINALKRPTSKGHRTQPGRKRFRKNRRKAEAVDVIFEELSDRIRVITVVVVSLAKTKRRRT